MATTIHETAVVDPAAVLGENVTVGPFSVVGPKVELGSGTVLHSHVVVDGITRIGDRTRIFPFASIGTPPQDLKYDGEDSRLTIGCDNVIREYVTMSPGTRGGGMETVVGDTCLFMVGSHVAHDCIIGSHVILSNNATLGGHVIVGDHAIIGGCSAVHQFVRIGPHAMIGGMTGIEQDVIPFGMAMGDRGHLAGLNIVGLKRRGFERDEIHALRAAFRTLFDSQGELAGRIDAVAEQYADHKGVRALVEFLRFDSDRKILKPRPSDAA